MILHLFFALAIACPDAATFADIAASHCVDGDTFGINIDHVPQVFGRAISVRLRAVNAAELSSDDACERAHAARAARRMCELLMGARTRALRCVGRDKYFRLLADAYFDGKDVAAVLLAEGYVVPYDGRKKPVIDWCARPLPAMR